MFLEGFVELRSDIQISVSLPISSDSATTVDLMLAGTGSLLIVQVKSHLIRGGRICRAIRVNEPLKHARAAIDVQRKAGQTSAEYCDHGISIAFTPLPSLNRITAKVGCD